MAVPSYGWPEMISHCKCLSIDDTAKTSQSELIEFSYSSLLLSSQCSWIATILQECNKSVNIGTPVLNLCKLLEETEISFMIRYKSYNNNNAQLHYSSSFANPLFSQLWSKSLAYPPALLTALFLFIYGFLKAE